MAVGVEMKKRKIRAFLWRLESRLVDTGGFSNGHYAS